MARSCGLTGVASQTQGDGSDVKAQGGRRARRRRQASLLAHQANHLLRTGRAPLARRALAAAVERRKMVSSVRTVMGSARRSALPRSSQ